MATRRLYRIDVKKAAYVYAESEEAAADFIDDLPDHGPTVVAKVREVHNAGEFPARGWDADSIVYTDGWEDLTLDEVWPGGMQATP